MIKPKMRKMYKSVENDIEYLVFESTDHFYRTEHYHKGIPPKGYEDMKYTKYIVHDIGDRTDTNYYYRNLHHNLYGHAFTRSFTTNNITITPGEGYYIYNKMYKKEDWIKESNIILRTKKINKILNHGNR